MSMKTAKKPSKTPHIVVKPNGNRLFIRPLANETTTDGGIILPEAAHKNKEVLRAEVIEVGPGMYTADGKRIAMPFKKGDVILYGRFSGTEVQIGTERYFIVTEPDILGTEEHT